MLFSESELNSCMLFKGCAHAYFEAWLLDSKKVCQAYYLKHEAK